MKHESSHYKLQQLSERIFWLPPSPLTDRPVLGAIVGERGTLAVDAGNSSAHAQILLDQLQHHQLPPPAFVAVTHWHWDHSFGLSAYAGIPAVGHVECGQQLRQMAAWDWSDEALDERVAQGVEIQFCADHIKMELPQRGDLTVRSLDVTFAHEIEIDLGDLLCRLLPVGGDHAADSVVVVIPQERVAFLSDCLYPNLYAPQPNYTPFTFFGLTAQLVSLDVDYYVWGHDPQPMPRSQFLLLAERMEAIGEAVAMCGNNRQALLAALAEAGIHDLDEEDEELIANFTAGI